MHRSIELGMDFFDTADVYGVGRNEELVGKAIRDRRDKVTLATKFANVRGPKGEFLGINGNPTTSAAPARRRSSGSAGRRDRPVLPATASIPTRRSKDTVGAMAELVKQGKVRHLGMSEAAPGDAPRAVKVHPIAVLQTEYSLWTRDPEDEVLPTCRELGIGFVAYSPLGRGFLLVSSRSPRTSRRRWRRRTTRASRVRTSRRTSTCRTDRAVGEGERAARPSQLALAWVLAAGRRHCPDPGTKRLKYLEGERRRRDGEARARRVEAHLQPFPSAIRTRYRGGNGGGDR
jgi:aryl-alcohol dehydrogenase-like predicted oxidoreductase